MATSQVVAVLQKAEAEPHFKQLLFNNPDEALKDYNLTADEKSQLSTLNPDNYETFKGQWIPGG